MSEHGHDPRDLESRLLYPNAVADDVIAPPDEFGAPEVILVEETHEEGHGLRQDAADAAASVGETAHDAASAVGGAAQDAASKVGDVAGDAASAVSDATTQAASAVKEAAPSKEQVKRGAHRVAQLAQESPFGLAITGACVGFLAGMLVPTTSVDEKIGPYAEQVVDKAREAGHSAVEQGKHAMQEAGPAVGAALRG